jgi:hypothetical protein
MSPGPASRPHVLPLQQPAPECARRDSHTSTRLTQSANGNAIPTHYSLSSVIGATVLYLLYLLYLDFFSRLHLKPFGLNRLLHNSLYARKSRDSSKMGMRVDQR